MRQYHRMILRMLPGPIVGALTMLMFLLVMQFLIRYLPDLVGKGLPFGAFVELIIYNLAYMLVLAVPMSILIGTLMTFGKLVDTNAYSVMKSSGVSFPQMVWPTLLLGLMAAGIMLYFNNEVLPEANFRASTLWRDIRVAKPGFDLKPGVFYDGIDQYRILVRDVAVDNPNELFDITIFDYTDGQRFRSDITAKRGFLESTGDGLSIELELFDGEMHRRNPPGSGAQERYERLSFDRHRLQISIEDLTFERSDPRSRRRSDRTMRSRDMAKLVDSLETLVANEKQRLREALAALGTGNSILKPSSRILSVPEPRSGIRSFRRGERPVLGSAGDKYEISLQRGRIEQTRVENSRASIEWAEQRADGYLVEIHKKNSIALACLIFMIIGAPLGLAIRRGGLGIAAVAAAAIFLFYWVTLVIGEKMADSGQLEPWIGMWAGNIVTGLLGIGFALYTTLDWKAMSFPMQWFESHASDNE